jgi:hypothetical protein
MIAKLSSIDGGGMPAQHRSDAFKRFVSAAAAGALLASASVASAHIVQMNFFTGEWFNVTGGPSSFSNTGIGNNPQVSWGGDLGSGQSGYNLNLAPPPPVPIVQNVPPNTSPFFVGDFTHVNQPISPNSITGIDLRINFDIVIDGTDIGFRDFFFHFAHEETTNDLNPCPYGGANGQGVNVNGCADRVLISFLNASNTFNLDGVAYTFNLMGFSTNGGATISNQFLTLEQTNNTAGLYATIQTRESVTVPEPGTLLLLGTAFIGFTFARRRKN